MRKFLLSLLIVLSGSTACLAQDSRPDNFRPSKSLNITSSTYSSLPLVFITVNGQTIKRNEKILASMKVIDNGNDRNYLDLGSHPNQTIDWEGPITIKYRGNSSFTGSNKKPFSIRPLKKADINSKKDKVSIMGMAKDNDWALLAPWQDRSYMRDVLTMKLARGSHTFAPDMKYCEVFVDGWYYGIYIMSERATKGKGRLNLDDPEATDLTGDFHVEIDRADEEHYYQSNYSPVLSNGNEITDRRITYQYKEPEYDDFAELPKGTEDAIKSEIDKMEDAFADADYKGEYGYRKYIDVLSFIDLEIAQEVSNNVDAYRLSSPLYKYSETHAKKLGTDAKWKTALWDFNIAYGDAGYNGAENIKGWRYAANDLIYKRNDTEYVPFFWRQLMRDPAYVSQLKQRWTEQRNERYSDENIENVIDSLTTRLRRSHALSRDNQVWSNHFGSILSEANRLKNYVIDRVNFMDTKWKVIDFSEANYKPVTIADGFNSDCIAEALPSIKYTNGNIDNGGWVLFSKDVREEGAIAGSDRTVTANNNIKYELAEYNKENTLVMKDGSEYTLTFDKPVTTASVSCLLASTESSSDITVVPNYSDGTSGNATKQTIEGWDNGTLTGDEVVCGLDKLMRGNLTKGRFDNQYDTNLYNLIVDVDSTKALASLTLSRSKGRVAVLAVSAAQGTSTGIKTTTNGKGSKVIQAVYGIDGTLRSGLAKGINIVRYTDGTTEKIVKK